MTAIANGDLLCQAGTLNDKTAFDVDNISNFLSQSSQSNIKNCEIFDLSEQKYDFNDKSSHLFLHVNISSLQAHMDELNELLLNIINPPSIIFISETRIYKTPLINVNIADYTFVHLPSPTKAGGIGAYVSRSLKFSENESLRLQIQGCEDLWFDVEIPGLKSKYVFAVIYRHPRNSINSFIEALDENMQRLNNKKVKALIMGDINIDLNSSEYTSSQSEYLNVLKSNGFSNLITKPTRVTATSQTTIDHILSNDYDSALTPGVFSYKLADHYPIVCKISTPVDKSNNRDGMFMFRNNQAVDGTKFRDDLEAALIPLTYDRMQTTITPQLLENSFKQLVYLITAIIEKHAPLQTASRKQKRIYKKPWINSELLKMIKRKQNLYKTHFVNGNESDKQYFKKFANKLTRMKTQAKRAYYHATIFERKNNPKQLWNFINNIIHTKRSSTNLPFKLTLDGNETDEPGEISECFNEYFVQIGELIAKKAKLVNETNFKTFLNNSITQSIVLDPPQPIEIYNIINSLNINKACGYDNISSFFLRMGGEILAPILSLSFSRAFDLGIFPSIFKIAKVVPIFKSGNKQIVKNYRPISLLPTLSKILEKFLKTRLIKFFDKYQVLYEFQYGFREKHSVLHALLDVNVFALDAIQSKQQTALLTNGRS